MNGKDRICERAVKQLEELLKTTDTEHAHGEADKIILRLLRSMGHTKVAKAYDAVRKWYA